MGKYIGIDLGTTYSAAACVGNDGKPRLLQNREGSTLTPSVVWFHDSEATVGENAKEHSKLEGDRVVAFAKREIGSRLKKYTVGVETYSPEAVSALVLRKIREDAEAALGEEVLGAVVTVPAYFSDAQRVATEQAAAIAKLPILAMINEPTAAALSYGITEGVDTDQTILVYDLGGGTFDVSIMRFSGEKMETLSSLGARTLGGYDFDQKIIDWFKKQAAGQGAVLEKDPEAVQILTLMAEKVKKKLSQSEEAAIELPVQGQMISASLKQEEFEMMIEPFIFQTITLLGAAVEEANLEYDDLDRILLVGGSTRIPLVWKMIKDETGITPSLEVHPDEAVALGAACYAVNVVKNTSDSIKKTRADYMKPASIRKEAVPDKAPEIRFVDRTSHGIGIQAWDNRKKAYKNIVIVPKNTQIPTKSKMDFRTRVENQQEVELIITQGEHEDMAYVTVIGKSRLALEPRPEGSPLRVVIGCDQNSVIRVRVIDLTDGKNLGEMDINRVSNLSDEEVIQAEQMVGKLDIG